MAPASRHRTPFDQSLADLLREKRTALNLTMEDVAERMQQFGHRWWAGSVSRTENLERVPTVPELVDLAVVLNTSPGTLIAHAQERAKIAATPPAVRRAKPGESRNPLHQRRPVVAR